MMLQRPEHQGKGNAQSKATSRQSGRSFGTREAHWEAKATPVTVKIGGQAQGISFIRPARPRVQDLYMTH